MAALQWSGCGRKTPEAWDDVTCLIALILVFADDQAAIVAAFLVVYLLQAAFAPLAWTFASLRPNLLHRSSVFSSTVTVSNAFDTQAGMQPNTAVYLCNPWDHCLHWHHVLKIQLVLYGIRMILNKKMSMSEHESYMQLRLLLYMLHVQPLRPRSLSFEPQLGADVRARSCGCCVSSVHIRCPSMQTTMSNQCRTMILCCFCDSCLPLTATEDILVLIVRRSFLHTIWFLTTASALRLAYKSIAGSVPHRTPLLKPVWCLRSLGWSLL